jgi:opacity protein-like surface antigen
MKHAAITSTVLALGILSAGSALAQAQQPQQYGVPWRGDFWGYVGASGGESKFRAECNRTITQFECDRKDTGFKVYAGGQLSQILGLEIGYTDFGRIRTAGGETDAWAVPLSLTAGVPIGSRFAAFGKVGGVYGRTDVTASLDSLTETGHKSGWGWTYGAGATFAITPAIQLRADWDRYKLDFANGRSDVDMLSAGVQFRF